MHPGAHAASQPDVPAVILAGSGETVTYKELDERSNRLAHLLRERGLRVGDHVAVLLENDPHYHEVAWAAIRSGMYVTPINWHLGPEEAGYIIEDCGAQAFVMSSRLDELAAQLEPYLGNVTIRLAVDGDLPGFESYDAAVADQPTTPIEDETEGMYMFYSSGTTGRPKGILPPLSGAPLGKGTMLEPLMQYVYSFTPESRYLCPAPLYHAAPLGWTMSAQRLGASPVIMEKFDAEGALRAIEQYQITHAQFVPTHFVRMLKLPEDVRQKYDLSSLEVVIHAAAPCPIEVKEQMIEWWGPKIFEYYSGSEGGGFFAINSEEWLAHKGSVGKPLVGIVHIVDEDGNELAPGGVGQIYFESDLKFEYHNDPVKTAEAFNDRGWSTLGDVGYVDEDGFLYLTDRVSHMIISGGVNIYPQEIENALVLHPKVADVAVIGVPDAEMGQSVKAVVQPADPSILDGTGAAELEAELIAFCRERLAGFKCPRSVDFVAELPRLPTGKLLKRVLRDQYESS